MARNKVDACIFCDRAPCICNVKQAAPKQRKKAAPIVDAGAQQTEQQEQQTQQPQQPERKTSSYLDYMKRAAAAAPPPPPPPPVEQKAVVRKVSDEDLIWNAAIRNLGPLLAPDERERYAAIISSSPHKEERKAIWKARRRDGEED